MRCGQGCDKEIKLWTFVIYAVSIGCNGIVGIYIARVQGGELAGAFIYMLIGLMVVAVCLLVAADMDLRTCTVYNYLWWLIGGVGVFLVMMQGGQLHKAVELLLFILLQKCFFYKMYGRADCYGFVACASVGVSFGMGLKEFLLHMLLAFGLLGIVQLIKGNVGQNGNLKRPVPFVPYLAVAFWLNLGAYLFV